MHCLFFVDRLRILVYVSESLIFATEKVVILKHKRLQVSILTKGNCFDEFSLKLQHQALWVEGKKMLKSYLPSLVINFKLNNIWNKIVQFFIVTKIAVMFDDLCCTESWLSMITD